MLCSQNAAVVGDSSMAAEYGWTNSDKVNALTQTDTRGNTCCCLV
eukprot:COSAG02_NODE_989_length_15437_cov_95.731860_9_plen_45_part_00